MDVVEVAEIVLLARAHFCLFLGAVDVVVAAEVKNAVGEQVGELRGEVMAGLSSLALGGGEGNGYVAEKRLIGGSLHEVVRFVREGEDVGWLIDPEELVVELPNLVIAGYQDGKGCLGSDLFTGHDAGGEPVQHLGIEGGCIDHDLDGDVVGNVVVHR